MNSFTLRLTVGLLLSFSMITSTSSSPCKLFNFGDSNSDTGAYCAWRGLMSYNNNSLCRASNGHIYIDFLSKHLRMGLLDSYLDSIGSNFTDGANFAMGMTAADGKSVIPLQTQAQQFGRFKNRVHQFDHHPVRLSEKDFRNGIYSIDIGQNDLYSTANNTYKDVVTLVIPPAIDSIQNTTKMLYELGARKFLVYNTGPLGCLPSIIEKFKGLKPDNIGCLEEYNGRAREFNARLSALCSKLRSDLIGTTIVYIDMYTIKMNLIANASNYGFERPLEPCTKDGRICIDPSRSINWDGIQYSEAADATVAAKIVSGDYSIPYMNLKKICQLRAE